MAMDKVLVIQVHFVMRLFQMDGLQTMMIAMMIVSPTFMTVQAYVMEQLKYMTVVYVMEAMLIRIV